MGVLCEVYIADQERALKYSFHGECDCKDWDSCKCWDEYAAETYDHVESHRIYADNFAQLLSILRGKKHRISVIKEFKMIERSSGEGPWIQKVPADLPELLAELTAKQLKTVATTWTEEIDPMPDDEIYSAILDYLKLLQKLCKKSVRKQQGMYLWTCL